MGHFFRSLFGPKKSNSKIKPRMQSRRLELVGLEERITPVNGVVLVDFTTNTGVLSLTSIAADFSVVANANGTLTVSVNSTYIVSAGSSTTVTVSSIGTTNDYTVSVNSGAASVKQLSLIENDSIDNNFVISSIDSMAFNTDFALNIDTGAGTGDTLTINGAVALKGTGALTTAGIETLTIAAAGDITAVNGDVSLVASIIDTAGDVVTTAGNIIIGDASLSGNVAINSTSGNLTMGTVNSNASNLTINEGTGTVTVNNLTIGTGNLTITTTNATVSSKASAISLAAVISGDVRLTSTGDIFVSGVVSVTSINAKSTAGDVIFGNTVTTSAVGGFVSEATLATKATQIANAVTVSAGANALVTGNLISNNSTLASITTQNVGIITITGNVDASVANNNLTLSAATGAITIGGNVGSSSTAMGDLISTGSGLFLASGNVTTHCVNVSGFTTSITFAGDVKTDGVNGVNATAVASGTVSFAKSIEVTNAVADVNLTTVNGNLTVTGAIIGKEFISIFSTSGLITLGAISTDQATGDISITNASGNIATFGKINTLGDTAGITLQTTSGSITTSGEITTAGNAPFFNPAGLPSIGILTGANGLATLNSPIYTTGNRASINILVSSAIINTTLTTSGPTETGGISLNVNGGSMVVNQSITAGIGGGIQFGVSLATDVITIAKTAPISSGSAVISFGIGIINLGASITAVGDLSNGYGIDFTNPKTNLTNDVSLKTTGLGSGFGSAIYLNGAVDGFWGLTLETPGDTNNTINITNLGQTTPLKTVTVTNSAGVIVSGNFSAANVVLADTMGLIAFSGQTTTITTSLTTAANAYDLTFTGTTVLAGAPVFLNIGDVSFSGITSLTSGVTITGGSLANVNLAGTIVSGGAFNIGAGLSNINVTDNTQLILNSTTAASTFASPLNLNAGGAGSFNLLGLGTLNLTANSTAGVSTGDTINVTNGTLNVTGTLGTGSTITLTNGTLTGPGGTIGALNVNTGTVAPGGTLNTGIVTLNAATNYNAAVLTKTTASNLKTVSAINLGGATLSLSGVASGLAVNSTFTIINNTAFSGGLTGQFYNQPEGSSISAIDASGNTVVFTISYIGGTNANDVTLTVTNVIVPINLPEQPMVVGQPVLNKFTLTGADAGGGPLVTVTFSDGTYTTFFAYAFTFTGGVRVAAADVNGDGILDIVTGAGPGGGPQVNVFSFNSTGEVVLRQSFFAFDDPSFTGGVYVAAGDTNNDHFDDVVIGAGAGGGPRVQVYGGSSDGVVTSAPLNDFFAYATSFTGGVVVAACDRTGDSFGNQEVITGPASNGGFNVKSFDVNGKGNNPIVIDNFFAFNDMTSIGGLSLAASPFGGGPAQDLVIGSTNSQFGVVIDQTGDSAPVTITANPFPGFTGAIRVGIAIDSNDTRYAIAAAGPGGGPVISLFSVGSNSLTQADSLFVFDPAFTGGLFASS